MRQIETKHGFKAWLDDRAYSLVADIVLAEQGGWFEPEIDFLGRLAGQVGGSLIDVGANVGVYSLAWCSCGGGKAIAFEPNPHLYERQAMNRDANRSAIDMKACALSDRAGRSRFILSDTEGRLAEEGGIEVDVRRLDGVIDPEDLPAPFILKIDAEGAEATILAGASRFLRRVDPLIMIERNPMAAAVLRNAGYALFRLLPGPGILALDNGQHDMINHFALSPSWLARLGALGLIALRNAEQALALDGTADLVLEERLQAGALGINDAGKLAVAHLAGLSLLARKADTAVLLNFSRVALALGYRSHAFAAARAALDMQGEPTMHVAALECLEASRAWSMAFGGAWTWPLLAKFKARGLLPSTLDHRFRLMNHLIDLGRIPKPAGYG